MFVKTAKQIEAVDVISKNTTTLLEGGARSGKSAIAIYIMACRACHYPNTWHLAVRLRLNHAKSSLWLQTIAFVMKSLGIAGGVKYNNSSLFIEFSHKEGSSYLGIGGLDTKERLEKVLGHEYATIYMNEASQLTYDQYEILTTRLNPPQGVPPRFIIDYNPPSNKHWGYKIFHDRKFPDGRPVPDTDFGRILMNPGDNRDNISSSLFNTLNNLSGVKRTRFLEGRYASEEGSLWKREWIVYGDSPVDLVRVVIGVDPSGSKDGDEIGVIAAGIDRAGIGYVLDDYSLHGSPKEWGDETVAGYMNHRADAIVAEKNYGGEMVEAVLTDLGRRSDVNVKMVTASRGKAVRAEPISALYAKGKIKHVKEFVALENELCTWKEGDQSPNRLDALVWAFTELFGTKLSNPMEAPYEVDERFGGKVIAGQQHEDNEDADNGDW